LAAILPENKIFSEAIDYLSKSKLIYENITKLPNTAFMPGLGGTGKTSTSIKYSLDYLIDVLGLEESDIWLSAPTSTQRKNLKKNLGRGIIKESDSSNAGMELISMAVDPNIYKSIISDLEQEKESSEYYTTVVEHDGTSVVLNWDKIKLNTKAAPKLLIVDEYTHFDNVAMQIFDKWTKVISAGDNTQSGLFKNSYLYNIDREGIFTVRTPKLKISLRDNNL